ncbi:hypothetical protein MHYP_G00091930 [Metynnis hypsauchen]
MWKTTMPNPVWLTAFIMGLEGTCCVEDGPSSLILRFIFTPTACQESELTHGTVSWPIFTTYDGITASHVKSQEFMSPASEDINFHLCGWRVLDETRCHGLRLLDPHLSTSQGEGFEAWIGYSKPRSGDFAPWVAEFCTCAFLKSCRRSPRVVVIWDSVDERAQENLVPSHCQPQFVLLRVYLPMHVFACGNLPGGFLIP